MLSVSFFNPSALADTDNSQFLILNFQLQNTQCFASPVRLACVRHAASVRPEPGSNSLKMVSQARRLKIFQSVVRSIRHCWLFSGFTQNYCVSASTPSLAPRETKRILRVVLFATHNCALRITNCELNRIVV